MRESLNIHSVVLGVGVAAAPVLYEASSSIRWAIILVIYVSISFSFFNNFMMSELPTDRAALDEYMAVWFRAEVLDTVELRSMVVRCHTQVQENVKGYLTYGWLERLRENNEEDSVYLEVLNALVDKLCVVVCKKEKDVSEMDY
ncbi:hypothetical protein Tco_0972718 [Tanacetum coccineum]